MSILHLLDAASPLSHAFQFNINNLPKSRENIRDYYLKLNYRRQTISEHNLMLDFHLKI